MIEKEQVQHIAGLAKLKVSDNEMIKYQTQLTDILSEIKKILDVKIPNEDIMISPSFNKNRYNEDIIGFHISRELAFKNAKHVKGDYIVVPKVVE